MASERFLVTGVLGCLGAWTARVLVEASAEVVGLDLGSNGHRLRELMSDEQLARVTLVQADVTAKDGLGEVLDEHAITNVIHLAALQIPFCREDPALGALVNVVGTVNVFEAVKARRDRIAGPLVYASSAAFYGEADRETATVDERADGHPSNHYGVYKQANEGNARIYWQDAGVASLGLRPANVYGPARDQGVTSEPTHAMRAAAGGEGYHINYGGRTVFNYTADVASAFVRMSRSTFEGAAAFNMPGTPGHMLDMVAAIEAAAPEVTGMITFDDTPLPVPADLATDGLAAVLGQVEITPLADGVRATIDHFRGA